MLKNYYAILRISRGATQEEIDLAYRQLCEKYHPGIVGEPGSYAKLQELNEAWHVLSDPYQRKQYNLALKKRSNVFFPPDPAWYETSTSQIPSRPRMQPIDIGGPGYRRRGIPTPIIAFGAVILLVGNVVGIMGLMSFLNHTPFTWSIPAISIPAVSIPAINVPAVSIHTRDETATAEPTEQPTPTETFVSPKAVSADDAVDNSITATAALVVSAPCPDGCTTPIEGCVVKGDIAAQDVRVYYLPNDQDYDSITINGDLGERWFCTEAEALSSGWYHVGNLPPTPTWHGKTDTPTPKPTRTPTPTRAPTTPVALTRPLAQPTLRTQTTPLAPTPTPTPTHAGAPGSAFKYSAPTLLSPSNGARYACAKPLTFQWTVSDAPLPLAGNEYFVIESTPTERDAWVSISEWTQGTSVTLNPIKGRNQCDALWWANTGTHEWRVRIVAGNPGTHEVTDFLSPVSPSSVISYDH